MSERDQEGERESTGKSYPSHMKRENSVEIRFFLLLKS